MAFFGTHLPEKAFSVCIKDGIFILQKIVFREIDFPLSDLIKKFNRATAPLNIITTNYDRIVEYACDYAGIGVNTGFDGSYIRRYSDEFRGQGRVNLAKVHGSLDTFRDTHGGSVAIPLLKEIPIGLEPEIITPGISKFEAVLEGTPRKLLTKADSYINNAQGYGVGLVVISQRPSEVNHTVLSQSSNFIAMRLTNADDQNVIKKLLPDSIGSYADLLPVLDTGEAIIVGDASPLPSRIIIDRPKQEPNSATVKFWDEWNKETMPDCIGSAVEAMRIQRK